MSKTITIKGRRRVWRRWSRPATDGARAKQNRPHASGRRLEVRIKDDTQFGGDTLSYIALVTSLQCQGDLARDC